MLLWSIIINILFSHIHGYLFQSMMQAFAADPAVAERILAANPMFANNPQMMGQMRTMMPYILQQMQNPEMLNLMANPQALNALMQIQQGVETLRSAAPSLVNTYVPNG